jgi:hypothetical protein
MEVWHLGQFKADLGAGVWHLGQNLDIAAKKLAVEELSLNSVSAHTIASMRSGESILTPGSHSHN